jgi:hypothetical protein
MSQSQLLIPEKINVGFQNRGDTYTAKLGYVIYYDHKGVLRKEKSWQGWRDQKIAPQEFKNEPTEGFVLNRKVGGYKSDWNYRSAKIRIYDPRDWEFEITLENLLFILAVGDCSRGKGLEGKFVYAWEGTELVLLPVASENYKVSTEYTELQSCKIKAKELIPGASYKTKKQEVYVYLGKFIKHVVHTNNSWEKEKTGPRQLFWDGKNFVFLTSMATLATLHSDAISPDFAELVDKYNKSIWGSKPVKFFTKKAKKPSKKGGYYYYGENWTKEEPDGSYLFCTSSFDSKYDSNKQEYVYSTEPNQITVNTKLSIKDDILYSESCGKSCYKDKATQEQLKSRHYSYYSKYCDRWLEEWIEPTGLALWVELESGSKFQMSNSSLIDHTKKEETYDDDEEYEDD